MRFFKSETELDLTKKMKKKKKIGKRKKKLATMHGVWERMIKDGRGTA